MDENTQRIKNEIYKQYKNLRQFSEVSGIPYTTLKSAFEKGMGGTAVETALKICKLLNIEYDETKITPTAEAAGVSEQIIKLIQSIKDLPEQEQSNVQEYIDFLKSKHTE